MLKRRCVKSRRGWLMLHNEDLDKIILGNEDNEPPNEASIKKRKGNKISISQEPYVKVPVSWFVDGPRPILFNKRQRLFLWLLYKSHFGERPVDLTSAATRGLEITRQYRLQLIEEMEADGWVEVERDGLCALKVRPLVEAGNPAPERAAPMTSRTCHS